MPLPKSLPRPPGGGGQEGVRQLIKKADPYRISLSNI